MNRAALLSRVNNVFQSGRFTSRPAALSNALGRQFNAAAGANHLRLANFFNQNNFSRLAIDQTTGQRVPLGQFLSNRPVSQFGNSIGALSNSFPTVGQSVLFPNGAPPRPLRTSSPSRACSRTG